MRRATRSIFTLAVLTLLAAPAASATWMFAQSFEPSTAYDTDEWMWQAPAPGSEQRIYFAAFSQYLFVLSDANANPNVAALGTQIEVSNAEHHEALLGVWVDCNADGYVGMAETAVREYSAALLGDTSRCPPVTGPATAWTAGAHNYNGWVSELVPIGRDALTLIDRRIYVDDEVRVWGDYHRPDEDPWLRACPVGPQPRGTYQTTGGFINFLDCRADIIGVMNLAFQALGDPMDWEFADNDNASTGALGRYETLGSEDSEHSAVTVWDCSRNTFRVGDALNQTPAGGAVPAAVHNVRAPGISPGTDNLDEPTAAGTMNHTREGLTVPSGDDCNHANDFGHDTYAGTCQVSSPYCVGEGDRTGANPNNKTDANWNMAFGTGGRGVLPYSLLAPLGWSGPAGVPSDHAATWGGSRWTGTSYWSTKPGFGTIRTHLHDPGNSTVEIAPGHWLTFYAHVGKTTLDRGLALPGTTTGKYASWHCGEATSGIRHGFNCDPTLWYWNADGTPYDPQQTQPGGELDRHELVRPGAPYELRDVDCYDGAVRGPGEEPLGVGVQPAYYGSGACY